MLVRAKPAKIGGGFYMEMKNAAVIGHPIGHTMSPFIHSRLFKLGGMACEYSVLDVENLAQDMDTRLKKLDAFNVTIPYKEKIVPYLDELDERGKLFGSVNTVYRKNGKLFGTTTDGTGCLKALKSHGIDTQEGVLILGNGGAARAIAFEMAYSQENFDICFAHNERSAQRVEQIMNEIEAFTAGKAGEKKLSRLSYETLKKTDSEYELIINTTSVGMYPNVDECVIPDEIIKRAKNVFDAVYNPDRTQLLKKAEKMGIRTVGGIEMLVNQAAAAHKIWYGAEFKDRDITEICKDALQEMERIFG